MKLPVLLWVALAAKFLALGVWSWTHAPWLSLGCGVVPDLLVLGNVFVPGAGGVCRVFTRFTTPRREIWLTIDDGPDEHDTPQILALLERHGARATFFVIGERAERHPALLAEILRRGHAIGHHTHTHPAGSLWCASPQRLRRELDRASAVLVRGGAGLQWFRAPAGIKHVLLGPELAQRGLDCVGWSIRSGDTFARTPEAVATAVMRRVHPGAIVLVHEGQGVPACVRVRAIALLLEQLAAEKFSCVLPAPAQLR